jgi:hypothetical protein
MTASGEQRVDLTCLKELLHRKASEAQNDRSSPLQPVRKVAYHHALGSKEIVVFFRERAKPRDFTEFESHLRQTLLPSETAAHGIPAEHLHLIEIKLTPHELRQMRHEKNTHSTTVNIWLPQPREELRIPRARA